MNFQLNHSILRKEGWSFRDLQNLKIGKDLQNHSCGQEKRKKKCSQNQVDFTHFWLDMNKTNDEIYQEVLRDMKVYIKQIIQKICDQKKYLWKR